VCSSCRAMLAICPVLLMLHALLVIGHHDMMVRLRSGVQPQCSCRVPGYRARFERLPAHQTRSGVRHCMQSGFGMPCLEAQEHCWVTRCAA
jgi:hypothetical protein